MVIAIDGPSGAGKSTLARAIAAKLGIIYADTGALYRTVGLYMYENNIDPKDTAAVIAALPSVKLKLEFVCGSQRIELCGKEVGDSIRTPIMAAYASAVSAIPEVRTFLLYTQRSLAENNSVVMDGRDIGTVIFPNAEVKLFLTADDVSRARRRCAELREKGADISFEQVLADMRTRDRNDSTRKTAPAVPAADATILDNSGMTLEETVDAAIKIIERKTEASGVRV